MTKITADWLNADDAQTICRMLSVAGKQAWFVGGCVRNALMKVTISDIDIATDAHPQEVMALAKDAGLKSIPTGIDHGTITVIAKETAFEITTFRQDVDTNGRYAKVAFSDCIKQDAARRDFTMNALYAAPDGRVVDPLGGLPDLEARKVRFIGEAEQRITEDYLRILRFFRFHAQYGDAAEGIDAEGLAACAAGLEGLEHVSKERVGTEMRKLLGADDPAPAMAAMGASGVLIRLLPGAGVGLLTVLIHIEQMAGIPPNWLRRLAAIGGQDAVDALRLSKADAAGLARLRIGMENTMQPQELGYRFGAEEANDILALRAASYERTIDPVESVLASEGAIKVYPVKAADLMPELSGPKLGERLRELEICWINSGMQIGKEELLATATGLKG